MQDNLQELESITDRVCLSEVSQSMIEGYIDLLGDLVQEINDNKIQALVHALEVETKSQTKNISDIEKQLISYKKRFNNN